MKMTINQKTLLWRICSFIHADNCMDIIDELNMAQLHEKRIQKYYS